MSQAVEWREFLHVPFQLRLTKQYLDKATSTGIILPSFERIDGRWPSYTKWTSHPYFRSYSDYIHFFCEIPLTISQYLAKKKTLYTWLPSANLTQTLPNRAWKISVHKKCLVFRVYVGLPDSVSHGFTIHALHVDEPSSCRMMDKRCAASHQSRASCHGNGHLMMGRRGGVWWCMMMYDDVWWWSWFLLLPALFSTDDDDDVWWCMMMYDDVWWWSWFLLLPALFSTDDDDDDDDDDDSW